MLRVDVVYHQDDEVVRRASSTTTQEVPRFLEVYRGISNSTFIGDPLGDGVGGAVGGEKTAQSTLLVIDCENKVVLAFVEISNPAHEESVPCRGRLSYPELVQRGPEHRGDVPRFEHGR